MSFCLGVDIGSITAKAVLLNTKTRKIYGWMVLPSGYNTRDTANKLVTTLLEEKKLKMSDIKNTISTGYSRKNVDFSSQQITEISCQAKGIQNLFPKVRTIIDIGGQDSKAIKIDSNGKLSDFEMNDKCSAGTGRFLEVMAKALEVPLQDMDKFTDNSKEYVQISSTCTVFAESEVVSRIAQGASRKAILAGIHESISNKVIPLAERIGIEPDVVITGGVAQNKAVVTTIGKKIKQKVVVPEKPQITGALGAALLAIDRVQ
ncbi:MAG: acyl-CoA dehydratase activase [Candidatus Hodarchaeales archaeon]